MVPLTVLFVLVNRGMRQLRVAAAYAEVARRMGLPVDTRGVSLQGHLNDQRIWIGEVMVGHGPKRRLVTWGVLDMDQALGLGLVIRRRGLSNRLFRRRKGPRIRIDDDLDKRLEIHGDDPARTRALFTPSVTAKLSTLMAHWPDVVVTDQSIRVHLPKPEASTERLERLVEFMIGLSDAIASARQGITPPERLGAHLEALSKLGTTLQLDIEPALPALKGDADGKRMTITPRRDGEGYSFDIRIYFEARVDTGFRLSSQQAPDGYWSVGQDIQVGDPEFDSIFVVKGYDPAKVRAKLTAEVRQRLLVLRAQHDIEVDDRCLHVRRVPSDMALLERTAMQALSAAASLSPPPPRPPSP
jgi:hypothetical protein